MGHLTHDDVARRWKSRALGTENVGIVRNHNMFAEGDILYSYGHHFELARAIRTPRRHTRKGTESGEVVLFLLNGDTYSNTTNKHQAATRSAVAGSVVPNIIIPFSVIEAAGIDYDSIRLLDRSDESIEVTKHSGEEFQPGWEWRIYKHAIRRPETDEEWDARIEAANTTTYKEWRTDLRWRMLQKEWSSWTLRKLHDSKPFMHTRLTMPRDEQHYQADAYCTRYLHTSGRRGAPEVTVNVDSDGTKHYEWETQRHWLGESLIEAEVPYTRAMRCKECGGFGRHPYAGEHEWNERCRPCGGRGRVFKTYRRRAKFLSGFDRGETRPSYFFTELPKTDAVTIEEALEALKPDTVKLAEQMGRDVFRQGDIFAVPLAEVTTRDLTKMGARYEKRGNLLGTNHEATEVAYLRDGRTLARGTLVHNPEWRRPDHRRVKLAPKRWHVIVKNTVPMSV